MAKKKQEVSEAAKMLGRRGGLQTLRAHGREQLKEWGKLGGKFGKLGGRPPLEPEMTEDDNRPLDPEMDDSNLPLIVDEPVKRWRHKKKGDKKDGLSKDKM